MRPNTILDVKLCAISFQMDWLLFKSFQSIICSTCSPSKVQIFALVRISFDKLTYANRNNHHIRWRKETKSKWELSPVQGRALSWESEHFFHCPAVRPK